MKHRAPNPNHLNVTQYRWPEDLAIIPENVIVPDSTSVNDWVVATGDTRSRILFSLFTDKESTLQEVASATRTTQSQSGATAGGTVAKPDKTGATQQTKTPTSKEQDDTSSD